MTDITQIPDGQRITETGAYRMSMDWYHDVDCCAGPSISSTGIRTIVLQSPHAFWKTSDLNPGRYPKRKETASLALGKAAHCLILGDEVFEERFAILPDDAPNRPTEDHIRGFEKYGRWPTAKARVSGQFWTEFDQKNAGKTLVKADQIIAIQYMAENIAANPLCMELLRSDLVEISMIWEDPITGIWVKSRPDCIPSNGYDFGDLKTFTPKGRDLVLAAQRSITDYGYYIQMALAIEGAEHVFGTTAKTCGLVFSQMTEPYEALPMPLDEDAIYWGRVLVRKGLDTMAECLKRSTWPGAGKDLINYSFPPSLQQRFFDMQASGDLPSIGGIQ